jgi:hypothetical protein
MVPIISCLPVRATARDASTAAVTSAAQTWRQPAAGRRGDRECGSRPGRCQDMSQKDVRAYCRKLRQRGLDIQLGRSGHWKIYRDGRLITTLSATPSDYRWMRNAERWLKETEVSDGTV